MLDASSMDGSICCSAATPARTEAGRLRTTKAAMMMYGVPTSASGLPMKQSAADQAPAGTPVTDDAQPPAGPSRSTNSDRNA